MKSYKFYEFWKPNISLLVLLVLVNSLEASRYHHLRHERNRQRRQFFFPQNITLGFNSTAKESGPWGPWTQRSECSRTCGGGVAYQSRICLDINRLDGSHSCVGPSKHYYSCNIQECPESTIDFRENQCSRFNTLPFEGKYYSWIPYTKATNPCELNCMPKGERFYYRHARKVIDGTRCYEDGSLDICVDGICMPVGCDKMLGSNVKEDKCRVCGGDGSSCRTVEGVFDLDNLQVGYNDILLIPAGATNIKINERTATNNYLAVRNLNGEFYLNGNWRIQFPSEIKFGGTAFHYERKPAGVLSPESLRAIGPITEPLFIVLLYQERNQGLHYEYSVPAGIQSHATLTTYSWIFGDYSECSKTCGIGIQTRDVHCARSENQEPMPDNLCDPTTKPSNNRTCSSEPCPAGWNVGQWGDCSCHHSVRHRLVYCRTGSTDGSDIVLTDEECDQFNQTKPSALQKCSPDTDCALWTTGMWEKCDSICGSGSQSREVNCTLNGLKVDDSECDEINQPNSTQECNEIPCNGVEWIVTEWSSCDSHCGSQMQTRKAICSDESGDVFPNESCDENRLPETTRLCPELPACTSLWFTSEWSSCSVKCGAGLQTRHVFCGHFNENGEIAVDEDFECNTDKPQNVSVCDLAQCEGLWFSGPFGLCTVPCNGGQKSRRVLCLNENDELVADTQCDSSQKPVIKDDCNTQQCDDDQLMAISGCKDSEFGCCPDGISTAGVDYIGCPPVNVTNGCLSTEFGCCKDQETAAFGPFEKSCPIVCNFTRYGCCPDGITPANATGLEGCPQECGEECETTTVSVLETTSTEPTTTVLSEELENLDIPSDDCTEEGSGEGSGEICIKKVSPSFETPSINCTNATFGCCPDGVSPANGDNFEGCDEGSGDSIQDNFNCTDAACITAIITDTTTDMSLSTTIEADNCSATEFGCCPNGKKMATGPRYYGCTCEDFPNGCCQDRYTPARGPEFDGCICSRMLYGCCNDGITPATGPNYEGCSCESSTYGCCPDMVSIAKGPNFAQCPCDSLQFGCCPGSNTPAKGPHFEGCSCANTPFGCCHDGSTIAYGPKFEGCPSGPSLDLKLASEVCGLQKERGLCRNFTVKWYFDVSYGGCNRFWYGGCEGNGNRFSSQEQCERSCVTPEGPERCSLPKVNGPCNGSYVSWYFNSETRNCEQFLYGGCLGNTNRFESRDICEQSCVHQETVLDRCDQPPSVGPCRGNYQRWYYRKEDGRCKGFMYGGCKGNQNNFQTDEECRNACGSQTPQEICALPKAEGPCLGNFPRWYYDNNYGVCREFTYSGCEGNKNRYIDKATCEKLCNRTRVSVVSDNICSLPKEEGPCRAATVQWYFNAESKRCERFWYGGCDGNANRFDDRNACESSCLSTQLDRNPCNQPKEPGNCYDYREKWYYDVEDRRCHRFYYSGCKGNENNFDSFHECNQRCGPHTGSSTELSVEQFKTDYCAKPYDSGPCTQNEIRWFYDRTDGVCKEFLYGGCDGNENRFKSRNDCETKCWNSQDICKLSQVRGTCSGRFTQWYFDSSSNECTEFLFSGCHGNANRFNSKETCETQCKSMSSITSTSTASPITDICQQSYDSGPCRAYFPRWYYSRDDNSCHQFIYGGCDGNLNRFETRKECELRCVAKTSKPDEGPQEHDSNEVVCRQEVESGPCTETQARWFYDPQSHTCLPFVYGGCSGNKNRFKSYELCMRFCSGISPIQPISVEIPSEIRPATETAVECSPSNCDDQRCPFGIDEFIDERGCSACRCSNPCYVHQCPEEMSCAVEVYRAENGEPRAQPVCRLRNKPGYCPTDISDSNALSSDCLDRCRTDADCRGDDKCCHNGCAHVCVPVEGLERSTTTTHTPRVVFPYEPYPSGNRGDATEEVEVTAISGTDITLECTQSTQYGRHASWSRDGQPLYLVNDKIQLLENGSLRISGVDNEDAGTYACSIDNAKTKYTKLIIHAPARILPGPQIVIAQLGLPSYLQCNAIGNPDPRVTWWRGEQMLPLNSIQFRQYSNFTLLIRRVGDKDGGIYTCQAYNGLGPIALWDVTLLLDFKSPDHDIKPYDPSLFNTTNIKEQTEHSMNGENIKPVDPNSQPSLTNTNNRLEPVTAEIRVATSEYTIGSTLQLECIVRGSHTTITWYFNSDIPLVSDNRHYRILQNNTLVVYNLSASDSGEYKCRASNQYNESSASVPIRVESVFVPPDCNDSPYFANCDLIVKAKYCNNPHYAKFCCRSCLLAGQIDKTRFS